MEERYEIRQAQTTAKPYGQAQLPLREETHARLEKLLRRGGRNDHAALWLLAEHLPNEAFSGKLYLRTIVEATGLPLARVSSLARSLQGDGLAVWTHDGAGEEGTYLQLTEAGLAGLQRQRQALERFQSGVVARFGQERFARLLQDLRELDAITTEELQKGEARADVE